VIGPSRGGERHKTVCHIRLNANASGLAERRLTIRGFKVQQFFRGDASYQI
jgi:hypothetical protein